MVGDTRAVRELEPVIEGVAVAQALLHLDMVGLRVAVPAMLPLPDGLDDTLLDELAEAASLRVGDGEINDAVAQAVGVPPVPQALSEGDEVMIPVDAGEADAEAVRLPMREKEALPDTVEDRLGLTEAEPQPDTVADRLGLTVAELQPDTVADRLGLLVAELQPDTAPDRLGLRVIELQPDVVAERLGLRVAELHPETVGELESEPETEVHSVGEALPLRLPVTVEVPQLVLDAQMVTVALSVVLREAKTVLEAQGEMVGEVLMVRVTEGEVESEGEPEEVDVLQPLPDDVVLGERVPVTQTVAEVLDVCEPVELAHTVSVTEMVCVPEVAPEAEALGLTEREREGLGDSEAVPVTRGVSVLLGVPARTPLSCVGDMVGDRVPLGVPMKAPLSSEGDVVGDSEGEGVMLSEEVVQALCVGELVGVEVVVPVLFAERVVNGEDEEDSEAVFDGVVEVLAVGELLCVTAAGVPELVVLEVCVAFCVGLTASVPVPRTVTLTVLLCDTLAGGERDAEGVVSELDDTEGEPLTLLDAEWLLDKRSVGVGDTRPLRVAVLGALAEPPLLLPVTVVALTDSVALPCGVALREAVTVMEMVARMVGSVAVGEPEGQPELEAVMEAEGEGREEAVWEGLVVPEALPPAPCRPGLAVPHAVTLAVVVAQGVAVPLLLSVPLPEAHSLCAPEGVAVRVGE